MRDRASVSNYCRGKVIIRCTSTPFIGFSSICQVLRLTATLYLLFRKRLEDLSLFWIYKELHFDLQFKLAIMNLADHGYLAGLLCDLVEMALPSSFPTSAPRAGIVAVAT